MRIIHMARPGALLIYLTFILVSCSGTYRHSSAGCRRCEEEKRLYRRIDCYTKMISADSANARLYLKRAHYYANHMKYQPALNDYLTAYELMPDDQVVGYNIACMYAQLGKVDIAAEWFVRAEDSVCYECLSKNHRVIRRCLQKCNQFNTIVAE